MPSKVLLLCVTQAPYLLGALNLEPWQGIFRDGLVFSDTGGSSEAASLLFSYLINVCVGGCYRLGYEENGGVKEGCSRDETERREQAEKVGQRLSFLFLLG